MGDLGDYWREHREYQREMKFLYQTETRPKDVYKIHELKRSGVLHYEIKNDGAGGEKYEMRIKTDRGYKTVYWWTSTGLWKVKKGTAEGRGIEKLIRYLKLRENNGIA